MDRSKSWNGFCLSSLLISPHSMNSMANSPIGPLRSALLPSAQQPARDVLSNSKLVSSGNVMARLIIGHLFHGQLEEVT
ncbi:hypothetical protein BDV27DRAFT_121239 [Aspergillus caelatus]|uniref:Uncharacterized protein n=1 Tax=Aspergillus caelatus TaxID=61420 RepID=A0A5N7AJ36_9EURO|nr:uncharacterized protein BDV27DRAFT_121239 [Aspergillus caelatus]KAE8369206.1 hypothetical protein BDV27DRAFT_121239 [Aspergillus caelatus]